VKVKVGSQIPIKIEHIKTRTFLDKNTPNMSLSSLKRLIRDIEKPRWHWEGPMEEPNFGADPDLYMDHIVHWVKSNGHPQTYGSYALWRITHQQQRIEQLESIVLRLIGEVEKLKVVAVAVPV